MSIVRSGVQRSSNGKQVRFLTISFLASVATAGLISPPARAQSDTAVQAKDFDIAPRTLSEALADFGRQSGMQVNVNADDIRGRASPGVKGRMPATQALSRLLGGTGLTWTMRDGFVTLEPAPQSEQGTVELGPLRVEGQTGAGGDGGRGRPGAGGAAGGSDEIFAAPRAVSTITREEMDRAPARHLADLIADTPGVASAVNRLDPGLSINIRGMQDFGRVNMMIDGMRQDFVENGHQQRNGQMYLDPELISGVTIERGPRTDVHGAGAIAGSVNFQTIDFADLIKDGSQYGIRLRGNTGKIFGDEGNGVNFLGSAAAAGKITDRLKIMVAYSRRDIGDYDPGTHGATSAAATSQFVGTNGFQGLTEIKYAKQVQDSVLTKARYDITDSQWVQFSYMGTWLHFNNLLDIQNSTLDANGSPYTNLGTTHVGSDNFGLEYHWKPTDSHWLDLNLKLYHVDTRDQNYTEPRTSPVASTAALTDFAWKLGYCTQNPIPASWTTACQYGFATDQHIETSTYGVQLDNTSRFDLGHGLKLSANYGAEYFQDRATSTILDYRDGQLLDHYNQYGQGDTLNPRGRRSMASGFANLKLENDFFTVSAGLRYDRYWLTGDTQIPVVQSTYRTRYDKYLVYYCNRSGAAYQVNCANAKQYGEDWVKQNFPNWYSGIAPYEKPDWIDQTVLQDYHVDREQGRFLPSLSAAIRPRSWVEIYASWAKSWRPPAINETLMTGGHPGDPLANMFPNPYADPEKTRSWEVGANLTFNDVARKGDVFFAKVGYFNTRATDYLYTSLNNNLPGNPAVVPLGFGNVMFVNNRAPIYFRGFEIESRYDAGFVYASVAATLYVGPRNRFCQNVFPIGAGSSKYDHPNEDGSSTPERIAAIAAGYPSYEAYANAQVACDNAVFNSVAGDPIDKVSATIGVRLFNRRLDTGLHLYHSGSGGLITYSDQSAKAWTAYTTLGWYGSFTLNRLVKIYASAENLTDQRYVDGYSDVLARTLAPGRTIQAGLQVAF